MGFFDQFLGNKKEVKKTSFWKSISSEEDLKTAIQESFEKPVIIFKHSTRCFISKTVLKNFEQEVENSKQNISFYLLDLLSYRSLSNQIAQDFGVSHQSPQIIVIKDGKAVKSASHQSINLDML